MLHVLFYIRSARRASSVYSTATGGAQQDRIVGGSQLIAIRMARSSATPWC